jgi:hypothetical protein
MLVRSASAETIRNAPTAEARSRSVDMQTWLRRGEKTELRASDISETSVLISRTVQELHFPCLHFEVKAAAKNGKARRV